MDNERQIAMQGVVDRVSSYQDGATERTVADELRQGFSEAGVDVTDDEISRLADAIEHRGGIQVSDVLG